MPSRPGATTRRFTLEEKIALVTEIDRRYRAGGVTLKAAAREAGTTETSYNTWLRAGIRPRAVAPQSAEPQPVAVHAPVAKPGVGRAYDQAVRERLLAQVDALRAAGRSLEAACRAVGIALTTYRKWRERANPAPAMRPVEVTALVPVAPPPAPPPALTPALTLAPPRPAGGPGGLTLVAPGGYRIEGLVVETAAALLRALQ